MSRIEQAEQEDSVYEQRAQPTAEIEKDDDSIFFISTQMQSIHEQVVENERNDEKIASQISKLKKFHHDDSQGSRSNSQITFNKVQSQPRTKHKPNIKSKKNQSMSAMVRDRFNSDKLSYFTGDQSKIDRFLKRIKQEEELDDILPLTARGGVDVKANSTSQLITQRDWNYFLKSIKLKFPNLRSSRKRNLKIITRKIALATQEIMEDENSLWSHAGSMPDTELTKDDLKWLYDLDEEEIGNVSSFVEEDVSDSRAFVLTLSQTIQEEEKDSTQTDTPSQGIIDIFSNTDEPNGNDDGDGDTDDENEVIVISDSESEVEELTVSLEKSQSYSQSQVQPGQSHLQIQESIYKPENSNDLLPSHQKEVTDPLISFQSFPFAEPKRKLIKSQEDLSEVDEVDAIEIISSPSVSKTPSINNTPVRLKRTISEISPFKTPSKRSKQLLDGTNLTAGNPSPAKIGGYADNGNVEEDDEEEEEEVISSDGDTIYSTARSHIYSNQLQQIQSPLKHSGAKLAPLRKVLQTTRYEVSNAFPIQDYIDPENNISLKRVGIKAKEVIDVDDIIPDSEDDAEEDNEISIVEITRIVDESDKSNTSILQVPSSPSKEMFSSQEIRKFLADQEHEVDEDTVSSIDFSKFTTTQLKDQFKAWGLKPVRGRDKMISILTEASKLTINSQTTDSACATRTTSIKNATTTATTTTTITATQQTMYEKLNEIIKSNNYWYEKIVSYEPLILEDMQKWLASIGYRLEYDFLQKYCDEGGICCTNQRQKDP